jgi:HEAT repeat protein
MGCRPLLYCIPFALLLALSGSASAQMTGNVDRLKADLHGDNLDRAVAAASALGSLTSGAARDALMGALQLGAPPKLMVAMIEALGLHKSTKTIDLLSHFSLNRRGEVREAALRALGGINHQETVRVLIRALGDSNPIVRARAARLLGERKERRAETPLFKMLKRGDRSAAVPLGIVAGAETAKGLGELLGQVPDGAIVAALGAMLKRADFGPDALRTEVVKTLDKIPGVDATAALVEYVSSVPEKELRMSKNLAEKVLQGRKK